MTLEVFSRDVVPVLQFVVTCIGLLSLILVWRQLKQAHIWNKVQAQQSLLSVELGEFAAKLIAAAKNVGVDLKARVTPLDQKGVERLWSDDDAYNATMDYIDRIQHICSMIQAGVLDDELAYHSYYAYVVYEYNIYEPFTDRLRKHYDDEEMGNEWTKTAKRWEERRQRDEDIREKEKLRGEKNILDKLGMPRRVK